MVTVKVLDKNNPKEVVGSDLALGTPFTAKVGGRECSGVRTASYVVFFKGLWGGEFTAGSLSTIFTNVQYFDNAEIILS